MSEETKVRRCLMCKKKLIDEFLPICPRCKLKGINGAKKTVRVLTGAAIVGGGVAVAYNNLSKDEQENDTNNDNGEA